MDVGIFMASGRRLKLWLILPPLLMIIVGMGSHAWQHRVHWNLQEAKAISAVLPLFIEAQKDVDLLIEDLRPSEGGGLGSADQLISFLQDMASQNGFRVDSVNVGGREKQQQSVPVLNASVRGTGDLTAIQMYINEVKTEQRLLSVNSIKVSRKGKGFAAGLYNAEIVFELILMDELNAFSGGAR